MAAQKSIGIIGLGFMGCGIAHCFAKCNYSVIAVKHRKEDSRFLMYLDKAITKGKLTEGEYELIQHNITETTDLSDVAECQFIIECIPENLCAKRNLFNTLDHICSDKVILSTNTSSIPVREICKGMENRSRMVGTHFFSPAVIMPLVEITSAVDSSPEVLSTVSDYIKDIGKIPVRVKDTSGFIADRLEVGVIAEAIHLLSAGYSDVETIDKICMLGLNMPIGPLKLADNIGLDVVYDVMENITKYTGEKKFLPPDYLRIMVEKGHLGRKSGKGFYNYGNSIDIN